MPFLKSKFQTYDAFARATLPEIYTESRLDKSLHLQATTATSGVLINDGKANFTFQ